MTNLLTKTTELAMQITLAYVRPGDTVIDATCGTGQDTAALAAAVVEGGRVYAFDIQDKALELTGERLGKEGLSNVRLIHDSFVCMGEYLPKESAAAAVFNLGYLPGGDHRITTVCEETLEGLKAALKALRPGGILTVVLYDGHEEGRKEKESVLEWAGGLNPKEYHAVFADMINQKNNPPEILWITKKQAGR